MKQVGDWYVCMSADDVKEVEIKIIGTGTNHGTNGDDVPSEYPFLLRIEYRYENWDRGPNHYYYYYVLTHEDFGEFGSYINTEM